jgi:hypothetical protein
MINFEVRKRRETLHEVVVVNNPSGAATCRPYSTTHHDYYAYSRRDKENEKSLVLLKSLRVAMRGWLAVWAWRLAPGAWRYLGAGWNTKFSS